jgi:hypothetical protein
MADVDKLRGQIRTLHDRSKSSKRSGAHYVVKTPSGGIPTSVGDEPGSADCTIHIRDGDPKELRDTTRPETVYNFGPAIPGDTILIAHRDAWGDLWAGESGTGGVCEELDLQPGSYRGIAGATTAPGETGPVIVTGCDGDVTIDAVNHSGCTFYLGDMITVNVDPCCVAHFTGCSCCGAEDTPPACCDRSIVICIAGERQILTVNGGTYTWDVSECCDCEGATLEVTITCEEDTITAAWEYSCGESTSSDTIDLSALCSDDDVEILSELGDICDGNLSDRWANFVEDCEPCGETPECFCCWDLQAFSVDNCDKTEVPGLIDDVGLTSITSSRDPVCSGLTTNIKLAFTNNSGGDYGGGADPIEFVLTSNVPTAGERPSCTAASDSGMITDDRPGKGFRVSWAMPGTWANGTTITRTLTMQANGCNPGVSQAIAQVYAGRGYICEAIWEATDCP